MRQPFLNDRLAGLNYYSEKKFQDKTIKTETMRMISKQMSNLREYIN